MSLENDSAAVSLMIANFDRFSNDFAAYRKEAKEDLKEVAIEVSTNIQLVRLENREMHDKVSGKLDKQSERIAVLEKRDIRLTAGMGVIVAVGGFTLWFLGVFKGLKNLFVA